MTSSMSNYGNKVFVGLADNERLPFVEEQFEAYVSNFSLQLVDDYEKMLSEAKRVNFI